MVKNNKEKGQKKRSLIIEHAKNELLIHGVNSLSLRQISNDLGISHGNLHYYFKTKDHLLSDIFNEEINKLNKDCVKHCVGVIAKNINNYIFYLNDINTPNYLKQIQPMDKPIDSRDYNTFEFNKPPH